jgi:putative two-component system response regulator
LASESLAWSADRNLKKKGKQVKALLVDDEKIGLKTLEVYTKNLGYDVLLAEDGHQAYGRWEKERPRLVITDWNMPGMDGVELCKRIREKEGDEYTYIVMVTARNETSDIVHGLEAGADDFLSKPVRKEELSVRLRAGERVLTLQSKDIVIFSLAKLAESRDTDTGNHLERIRYYSKTLANQLMTTKTFPKKINALFIDNLFLTSPLHDIGKVGIPDYILLKPGRLDDQEFSVMKTHTTLGYETLNDAFHKGQRANYLKMAAQIARHHHEKYDGSGYPDGLAGEEIPLCARIVALADVYDALVSHRAYKDAFSHERARAIIVEGTGKHFDPRIVQAFFDCELQFVGIHNNYKSKSPVDLN